ncbi:MAG: hypothetical protein ACLUE2_14465 [Bacteroides cellulosilyticus]
MKKNVLTLFVLHLLTLAGFPSCSDKENKGEAMHATPSPQTFPASGQ